MTQNPGSTPVAAAGLSDAAAPTYRAEPRAAVQALEGSAIRLVADAAMGLPDVLGLWFGESDLATPACITAAAIASLQRGDTYYLPNLGVTELRQAIAAYLGRLHPALADKPLDYQRIAVTSSGVSALALATQTLVSPGDRVVVITPCWPNIAGIPAIAGAQVVRVPLRAATTWELDEQQLLQALTPETRMLVINSPQNPTGWMADLPQLQRILAHCRRHGIWILSDEVYARLHGGDTPAAPSLLDLADPQDRVLVVGSCSKAWAMTGWRLGWIVAPDGLTPSLAKLIEYNTSCAPGFVQAAALAAVVEPQAEQFVAQQKLQLAANREQVMSTLAGFDGLVSPRPQGAFYAFFKVPGVSDSVALAKHWVQQHRLGLAPGRAFGPEGEGWIRLCYAVSPATLDRAMQRLQAALRDPWRG